MATDAEASLMSAALSPRALAVPLSPEMKGTLRARMMKSMILTLANKNQS